MSLARVAIFASLLAVSAPAWACSVPVFRYALNYWPADDYELRAAGVKLPDDLTVNLALKPGAAPAANLMLGDREVWSGEMKPAALAALLDSPVRRQIISRILHGDSVVWVLVECGDPARDDAAAEALSQRLKYLESIAVMPELRPDDPFNRIGPGPALAIRHSVIRLSRQDPRESFTLAMLEREPADPATPTAYPVFGRGRVLIALPQEKLTADNIDEVAQFLTSACSCEIKDTRQGWDLLLAVDWDEELARVERQRLNGSEEAAGPTTRDAAPSELAPQTITIAAPLPLRPLAPRLGWSTKERTAAAFLGMILVGIAGGFWMRRRA